MPRSSSKINNRHPSKGRRGHAELHPHLSLPPLARRTFLFERLRSVEDADTGVAMDVADFIGAIRAPESTIAVVVGHKRHGTLGCTPQGR